MKNSEIGSEERIGTSVSRAWSSLASMGFFRPLRRGQRWLELELARVRASPSAAEAWQSRLRESIDASGVLKTSSSKLSQVGNFERSSALEIALQSARNSSAAVANCK